MRIRVYLRVVSDEATISSIHNETSLPEANIKELKAPRGVGGDMWWTWQTAYIPLDIDDPDAGLKALLFKYKPIFPVIRKYSGPDVTVCLQMVTRYEENEDPRGLSLSAETIALLSELGGALDNDVETYGLILRKTDTELVPPD